MKIAVIGFGAAAIGLLETLKDTDNEIHVFEKSADIYSSSISGIRADGKLFVSDSMGGDISIPTSLQKQLVDFYLSKTSGREFETGSSFTHSAYYNLFYSNGFEPVSAAFTHLGTDQLRDMLFNIYGDFCRRPNIRFHFGFAVEKLSTEKGRVTINNGPEFDHAVVCVGRSGHRLIRTLTLAYPELVLENTKLDLGVRFELPDHILSDINREMYEFKIRYRSRTGYMVRTFCNNPSGYVVDERYEDFTTVNGHAKIREKSSNTNFAILTTVVLTEPFNDPIGYGSHIAKLTNLLAGENRVILQTYGDLKNSKRTKKLYRVQPTLPPEKYILGDINLAFPRRIVESITDFTERLGEVIPGAANDDNLVYAPEIKFYSYKLNNQLFDNLWFAGDCSGFTRSIIYATAHGFLTGQTLCSKQ